MIAGSSLLRGVVLSVAVALGIQNHNDSVLDAQVVQSELELGVVGARIVDIKTGQFGRSHPDPYEILGGEFIHSLHRHVIGILSAAECVLYGTDRTRP